MPSLSKNHGVIKMAVFSHCFPKKKNQQLEFLLSYWFSVWTSQGLNLGPPDYESVALTNWATSPIQGGMHAIVVMGKLQREIRDLTSWEQVTAVGLEGVKRSTTVRAIPTCGCKGTKFFLFLQIISFLFSTRMFRLTAIACIYECLCRANLLII